MHCPNCGHENTPDARFCAECGTALQQAVGAPPPPHAAAVGDGLKWGILVASLVVPVLGVVMGIIYMNDANPQKKPVGKLWLWVGIIAMLFWCVIGFIGGMMGGMSDY